jgi:hypothetical protein
VTAAFSCRTIAGALKQMVPPPLGVWFVFRFKSPTHSVPLDGIIAHLEWSLLFCIVYPKRLYDFTFSVLY